MRAISSGVWLKNCLSAKLKVIWLKSDDMIAEYNDLFLFSDVYTVFNTLGKYKLVKRSHQKSKIRKIVSSFINYIISVDVCLTDNDIRKGPDYILKICENAKVIYIFTCERFAPLTLEMDHFKIKSEIYNQYLSFSKMINKETIGIHIRRTDNIIAIQQSPLELFEERILYEIKLNPNVLFFLSTDDVAIESYFSSKYSNYMIVREKVFGRSSIKGIKDGLIDILLLSKSCKIYGSYWSSFSEVAGLLGENKVEILVKH